MLFKIFLQSYVLGLKDSDFKVAPEQLPRSRIGYLSQQQLHHLKETLLMPAWN